MTDPATIGYAKQGLLLLSGLVKSIAGLTRRNRLFFVSRDDQMFWTGEAHFGEIPCMQVCGTWSVTAKAHDPIRIAKVFIERRWVPRRDDRFPFVRVRQRTLALMNDAGREGRGPSMEIRVTFFVPKPLKTGRRLKATVVFVDNYNRRHLVRSEFRCLGTTGQETRFFDH